MYDVIIFLNLLSNCQCVRSMFYKSGLTTAYLRCVCVGGGVKFLSFYVSALYWCVCVFARTPPSPSLHGPRVGPLLMSTHTAVARLRGSGHYSVGILPEFIAFFSHADQSTPWLHMLSSHPLVFHLEPCEWMMKQDG